MRFSKLTYLLLTACLVSTSSFATIMRTTVPWNNESLLSIVSYTPTFSDYSSQEKIFVAGVSHSKSGSQRLYFQDFYKDYYAYPKTCNGSSSIPDTTVLTFNNQAVKMLRWCKRFEDSKDYYEYTPATERGHNYVVNLFKTSTTPIRISISNNDKIYIPVMGFTKVWNSAGGNAI